MFWIRQLAPRPGPGPGVPELAPEVLLETVRSLAFPRCWHSQPEANRRAAGLVRAELERDGRHVVEDEPYRNLIALPPGEGPVWVVGAHYDSVSTTPGADDNASAVAVMLGVSHALARLHPDARVGFVAFNAEEDGIIGSRSLAERWQQQGRRVRGVHVLEMLGFASSQPGSQQTPPGWLRVLPLPDVGDFIGLLAQGPSRRMLRDVHRAARASSAVRVVSLQTLFGAERWLPSLDLSDHVRFWEHGIPSVLWTDTAFYRNPHYHLPSDTPDTLDPQFMSGVAHLLLRTLVRQLGA